MNTVANLGVSAINKARQADVEAKAMRLINLIDGNQKSIKCINERTAGFQAEHQKLAEDVVKQEDVLATPISGATLNPNQVTILNAIRKINDSKQEHVSLQSQGLINKIDANNKQVAGLNKQIGEWREELSKLSVDVIDAEVVLGNS